MTTHAKSHVKAAEEAIGKREALLETALNDGRIHPDSVEVWRLDLERDPTGGPARLAALTPGPKPGGKIDDPGLVGEDPAAVADDLAGDWFGRRAG
jgi:hypothetical protein